MNYKEAYEKLETYNQLHILKYYDTLDKNQQQALLNEIAQTDFSVLAISQKKEPAERGVITPIEAMELAEIEEKKEMYEALGMEAIKAGKAGAVLLAGGMGTRLGSDQPKGMYNIGLTKNLYIFERIVHNLMDVTQKCSANIHLFVMTSDKNHIATTTFFEEQNYFGYDKRYIHFFQQDMAPASDYNGSAYMEKPWKIATSPNGNGGWFSSMIRSGMSDIIKQAGIEWLNVFAVDNVLQRIADPVFLGAILDKKYLSGSKVIKKASPDEKVGVMCLENGHPSIVEYYELTEEMKKETNDKGEPAYNFGVTLNYFFHVPTLETLVKKELPLHIVEKKIPHIDESGNYVNPQEPNGYKYESLILDMIYMMDTCLPFEVVREKEFAPIKNKTGVDSVDSARILLQKNGVEL